jgi:hypothetical protein
LGFVCIGKQNRSHRFIIFIGYSIKKTLRGRCLFYAGGTGFVTLVTIPSSPLCDWLKAGFG